MAMVRVIRGMVRLPAAQPQFYAKVALDRVGGAAHFWLTRRMSSLVPTAAGGSGSGRVHHSAVGRARDERVGLAPSLRSAIGAEPQPLPLGVPVPMRMAVPVHQAGNAQGFVFAIDASCECQLEVYTPAAAARVRDTIIATAQAAARAEMVQGGWQYDSINLGWRRGWEMERFAERVHARMVSAAAASGDITMKIDFKSYNIAAVRLDPAATTAFAATQAQDPAVSLLAVSFAELIRQINADGPRVRTTQEKLAMASRAATNFTKVYAADRPVPPPQRRTWILGLFHAVGAVAFLLPVSLLAYSHLFPEDWAARKDSMVAEYANSFIYRVSSGFFGETMVQKHRRVIAEAERLKQQEERARMREEERMKRAEERRRRKEANEARWRAEALAERYMTPWERLLYRANAGDRRFERYRRRP